MLNTYLAEALARQRLDEARAQAARRAVIRSLRPVPKPLRVSLGLVLIRTGRWLAGTASASRSRQPKRVTA